MATLFGGLGLHIHNHTKEIPITLKSSPTTLTKDQLKVIFMEYDTNHDNLLSREELKKAFDLIGALFPGYRANRGLSHADANGDGLIDLKELDDLVNYANKLGYTVK